MKSPTTPVDMKPEDWVEKYGSVLFRYARGRVSDASVAEDLVQETFLAALKSQHRYAGTSSIETWLIGILKHKVMDYYRKHYTEASSEKNSSTGIHDSEYFDWKQSWRISVEPWDCPQQALESKEFLQSVQHCLRALPSEYEAIFRLRVVDDLSYECIAEMLKISLSSVGVKLHRARLRIRQCMDSTWFQGT